jgi:hypothetical protein
VDYVKEGPPQGPKQETDNPLANTSRSASDCHRSPEMHR